VHVHPAFPVAYALVEALARILPWLRAEDPALARALRTAAVAIPPVLASARLARPGPRAIRHLHRAYLYALEARMLLLEAEARRCLPPPARPPQRRHRARGPARPVRGPHRLTDASRAPGAVPVSPLTPAPGRGVRHGPHRHPGPGSDILSCGRIRRILSRRDKTNTAHEFVNLVLACARRLVHIQ
jgi:hypothetical protein